MAATLAVPSALAAGRSAARLQNLDGFDAVETVEIVVSRGARVPQLRDVTVHYSRLLSNRDRHVLNGIPVTVIPVTLIHLAEHWGEAEQALDSALRQGKHPLWLRDHLRRWESPQRRGPTQVLELLDDRVGKRLPLSWFQRLAARLLAEAGVATEDEYPVFDHRGRLLAVLDLALPPYRIGIECQGWKDHGSPTAQRADNERKRRLRTLGWEVIEVWWSDLEHVDTVVADIHLSIKRRRSESA